MSLIVGKMNLIGKNLKKIKKKDWAVASPFSLGGGGGVSTFFGFFFLTKKKNKFFFFFFFFYERKYEVL